MKPIAQGACSSSGYRIALAANPLLSQKGDPATPTSRKFELAHAPQIPLF